MYFLILLFMPVMLYAQTNTVCESGLAAFSKTLHPELVKSCSDCHGVESEAPSHSQDDPKLAYAIARPLADFTQIDKSQFIKKVRARHWLKHDPTATGMTEEKMTGLLNAWYISGEKDCPSASFSYVTTFVKIPKLADSTFQKMQWKMKRGIVAEIEVQRYHAEEDGSVSLRFRKPRISSEKTFKVSGINLMINNETSPLENAYVKINQIVKGRLFQANTETLPFPLLSVEDLITVPRMDQEPVIALAFNEFSTDEITVPECKKKEVFEATLYPEIKTSCLSCHSTPNAVATQRFDMNIPVQDLCQEFTVRPGVLYELAVKGRLAHPVIPTPQATNRFKKAFALWND